MGFITHIPGTQPVETPIKHERALGVGVLGLHEGRTLLLALESRCRYARAVAGCDLSEEKRHASASELPHLFLTADYDKMLARPEVDIVAIYTPDALHADHIEQAFEAGKDVICTKPLIASLDDARRILAAGRKTGRKLLVGQSSRFFEPFRRQRAALERGEFGGLEGVELIDAHYIHRMDWYYRKSPWVARDADWIFLGMSHPIDLVRWYLGRIKQVSAYGFKSAMGREFGVTSNDVVIANFVAQDGRIGRAMGHYGCHELPTARNCIELMVYGTDGTSLAQYHDMKYVHTGLGGSGVPGAFEAGEMEQVTEDCLYAGRHYYFGSEVHGMHYGEFANYADHFARSLIEGKPASPGLEEGVETFCVMEAVRRSSVEGRPVEVGPLLTQVGIGE
ncbi:MAG: Gfo/Idh/MocA family oxidoreductase [Phycisphaeraceae bacterium]|nr:Gfo/Idh/MocA family oxidoreductase [Phycisphaeraceae bacterium]MCW5762091.1 Gfo/Idh/MocA family oxidoreductase [Phycisphaeraceae bacterium]